MATWLLEPPELYVNREKCWPLLAVDTRLSLLQAAYVALGAIEVVVSGRWAEIMGLAMCLNEAGGRA